MTKKGAIVISETMLLAIGVIISFLLLTSLGSMIFQGQSESAGEASLTSIAKDIASTIDRAAAEAGSVKQEYKLPKGMILDVGVNYKSINITSGDTFSSVPFQALTHTRPYVLNTPAYICIVKNQDDMRIALDNEKCRCVTTDKRCDPACIVSPVCDPKCNVDDAEDHVCDKRCSKSGDKICDLDCFAYDKDKVNEAPDCIKDFEADSKGYKRSKTKDRICDADSHLIEDKTCDIDCLNNDTSVSEICDLDCNKYNMTQVNGTYFSEDGYCDLDCGYTGTNVKRLKKDGVCDLDCAGPESPVGGGWLNRTENGICDPDCSGRYDPDCGKCAGPNEDCSSIKCCGEDEGLDLACCPGSKTCAENKKDGTPACDGNGWCEISPFSTAPEDPAKHIVKWVKGENGTYPKNWENPYTTKVPVPGKPYKDCTDSADGICYSEQTCFSEWNEMNGYKSCYGAASDPDCDGLGNGCAWVCQAPCTSPSDAPDCGTGHGPGGASTGGDNICSTTEDGVCDPDCDMTKWKLWDPDCQGLDCGLKVDKGGWTAGVCADDGSIWSKGAIQVCETTVTDFLDRRGWDIGQMMKNLMADTPDGWAFDFHRYYVPDKNAPQSCDVQPASLTINTNENYMSPTKECCDTDASNCGGICQNFNVPKVKGCCGVGFCADHSSALLSILRTMGVPAYNVWSAFNDHHAWIALQCNSSIENLGKYGNYKMYQNGQFIFDECRNAGDGKWIAIDPTWHETFTLPVGHHCNDLKEFWNDQGRYGFQGIVCDGKSIVPTDADNCVVSGTDAVCDCPWCDPAGTPPTSCSINHPHGNTESCSVLSGKVSCPFRKNPKEAGGNIGCS